MITGGFVTRYFVGADALQQVRLADAAPDLLEALQEMVVEKSDYMLVNNLGDPEREHTIKLARAAITKALPTNTTEEA